MLYLGLLSTVFCQCSGEQMYWQSIEEHFDLKITEFTLVSQFYLQETTESHMNDAANQNRQIWLQIRKTCSDLQMRKQRKHLHMVLVYKHWHIQRMHTGMKTSSVWHWKVAEIDLQRKCFLLSCNGAHAQCDWKMGSTQDQNKWPVGQHGIAVRK